MTHRPPASGPCTGWPRDSQRWQGAPPATQTKVQAGWDLGPTAHVRKQPRPDVPAQVNFMHSFGAQSRNLVGKRWSVHLTFSQRFGFLPAICKPVRSHHNSTQQHAITIVRHATPQSQGTCAHPSSSSESLMSSPIGFSSTGCGYPRAAYASEPPPLRTATLN